MSKTKTYTEEEYAVALLHPQNQPVTVQDAADILEQWAEKIPEAPIMVKTNDGFCPLSVFDIAHFTAQEPEKDYLILDATSDETVARDE